MVTKTMKSLFLILIMVGSSFLYLEAAKKKKIQFSKSMLNNIKYRSIGPTRASGRFVDFAVSRQDAYVFYAATASGGLWKTENNGNTFKPIFDDEKIISIGDIAVAPRDDKIVWVGTGEANNSRSSYWGDGVYKSTDAGKTWKNMGLRDSHHIGRIIVHPENPDIVYVASLGHLYSENQERGLYKTEDGGKTWKKCLSVFVRNKHIGVVDLAMDPSNPDILYACSYDKVRKPYTFNLAGPGSGIYKTIDGGKNWNKLAGGLPAGPLGRIGVAIYAKNPNILYTTIENANKPKMSAEDREKELLEDKSSRGMIGGEVYRSDDGGDTWKKVSPDGKSIGGAPGYYYGQIIIDPNNDQVVHVLSAASWGTYDGGKTWKRRPLRFGGDDHALWINPRDSRHMWLGYDHGLGITHDGGKTWYHPDNLPLAQMYAVGVDMSYPYRVAGGLQDNGSAMGPSTNRNGGPIKLEDWQNVGGGDGMYNVFDQKTNRFLYNESQFGPLVRTDLHTGERKSIAYRNKNSKLRWNWNAPILVSPHDGNVIYHGANVLVKSQFRGEYWQEISKDLTTNDPKKLTTGKGGDGNIQYCTITTIDESPISRGLLWVGTDDGNVWISRDDGGKWTKLNDRISGNPGYWVSRVAASPSNPGTAYVTYTGYRRDDFRPFVFKTTDFGQTWISIAANLPPREPINVIREHHLNANLLFVGTELGVYVSINGGRNWTSLKSNMPTQPVHDLLIHPRENDLVVATHGRGIFIADISPLQEISSSLLLKKAHVFNIQTKIRWINNKRNHSSSANYNGKSEPRGMLIYYYLKNKIKGGIKVAVYKGSRMIDEFKGSGNAGIQRVVWSMRERRLRTKKEKQELEKRMKRWAAFGYKPKIDINYIYTPAAVGQYRFEFQIGKAKFVKHSSILKDHWY